jgi:proteic killer suppression protein
LIKSFKHKGLQRLFLYNDRSKINPNHAPKLIRILDRLDASVTPQDMNLPGYKLHELKGKEKGTWSVWVSGNWRITFQFEANDAINVDYEDYH